MLLQTLKKVQTVFKIWRTCSLILESKFIVLKIVTISKIFYLSILIKVPAKTTVELGKSRKNYLFGYLKQKPKTKLHIPISEIMELKFTNK